MKELFLFYWIWVSVIPTSKNPVCGYTCAYIHTQKFPVIYTCLPLAFKVFQVWRILPKFYFSRFLLIYTAQVSRSKIWLKLFICRSCLSQQQSFPNSKHMSLRIRHSVLFVLWKFLRLEVGKNCLETKFNKYCIILLTETPRVVDHFPLIFSHGHYIFDIEELCTWAHPDFDRYSFKTSNYQLSLFGWLAYLNISNESF